MTFSKPCEFCGSPITTIYKSTLNVKRFCSRSCRSKRFWVTTGPTMKDGHIEFNLKHSIWHNLQCNYCGIPFKVRPSRLDTAKFCSKSCSNDSKRVDNPKRHRTTFINGKLTKDHIVIVEKILGRKMEKDEHIHHINDQKRDNKLKNLIVITRSQHTSIHNIQRHNNCHLSAVDIINRFPNAIWMNKYLHCAS